MIFDKNKYYRGYLAPILEQVEIDARSSLVETLKNGHELVRREKLVDKYPADKLSIVKYTLENPDALRRYRASETALTSPPMTHREISNNVYVPTPDFGALLEQVEAVSPGRGGATAYHRNVESLLSALVYPALANVRIEREIHEGRKRIDIAYDNLAPRGFFHWISLNYRAATIPVECKNYSEDPANPELDQLAGRFSRERGQVGLLLARDFGDKQLFLKRCRDTAGDGRGFIIPLDDEDLRTLCMEVQEDPDRPLAQQQRYSLLRERFDYLIA
jgi:hypothetical protein